jgi:hypothetical protein
MTGLIPLGVLVLVWALGILNGTTVVEIRRRPTTRGERRGKDHA